MNFAQVATMSDTNPEVPARKKRIMFVDDDMDIVPLYELAGEIEETILTVQNGGLSALKQLDKFGYEIDAVVMDLSMPDMDGITLTRQIRRNEEIRGIHQPMCIFWFTGYPINDIILDAKTQYGVKDIFNKPHDPVDIVRRIKESLEC